MENNFNQILREIEEIIAKLGNYNIGKAKFSVQGKKELQHLFKEKIKLAKSINSKACQLVLTR